MIVYSNIEKWNDFQEKTIEELKEDGISFTSNLDDSVDIMLLTRWEDKYLDYSPKAVFVPYTGLNRFPMDEFKKRGIYVSNSHAKAHLVAERALSLALSVLGKIKVYDQQLQKEGYWATRAKWGSEFWLSLYGKKVGIIGMGHIGTHLYEFMKPFHIKLLNLTRDLDKNLADEYYSLDDLLYNCDILVMACPLNETTKHMINMENIHLLKDKVIVNIARGEVIEEEALYRGLKDNILYGAGIDVWYQYPTDGYGSPSKFDMDFPNLVMSPHASCHAKMFEHAYYKDILNQIKDYKEVFYESRNKHE